MRIREFWRFFSDGRCSGIKNVPLPAPPGPGSLGRWGAQDAASGRRDADDSGKRFP